MTVYITDTIEVIPLETAIQAYAGYCEGGNQKTQLAKFRYDLPYFLDFARSKTKRPAMRDLTRGLVEGFINERLETEAPQTVARRAQTVCTFCRWAARQYPGFIDPTWRLPLPRFDQPLPKCLDLEQVTAVLKAARESGRDATEQARTRVMVELLALCGLRAEEVCLLAAAHFSRDWKRILKVTGKGRHFRNLPLPEVVRESIKAYLPLREQQLRQVDGHYTRRRESARLQYPLLISTCKPRSGGFTPGLYRLAPKTVWNTVTRVGEAAGVKIHPHLLRHTFAHVLLERTKNIAVVARALGHTDINTTMRYVEPTESQLTEAMR